MQLLIVVKGWIVLLVELLLLGVTATNPSAFLFAAMLKKVVLAYERGNYALQMLLVHCININI